MEFGLLLPHFGEQADPDKVTRGARRAEELGFASVWVRDHLLFEPHGEFEKPDNTFYEALTTLMAAGMVTERLKLGTGALIPFRNPVHLALTAATMTQFLGDRLILGMGSGNDEREFEAAGLGGIFRPELVESNARLLRRLWSEDGVDHADDHYQFTDLSVSPKPPARSIPYWYCGNVPATVRRAVAYCDGWMPGRISLPTMRQRIELMEQLSEEAGRQRPTVGMIPVTSVESSREAALDAVSIPGLCAWANKSKYWVRPESGTFETAEDLEGVLIAGTPDQVVEQVERIRQAGVDHVVFDFRMKFERWDEQIELIGTEVLPHVVDRS